MSAFPYAPGRSRDVIRPHGNAIEILVDVPPVAPRGIAVVAHPHPLLGGSAQHPVPHELAASAVNRGWIALRPNFRGVGKSAGKHNGGPLEIEDLLSVVQHARSLMANVRMVLMGFSFGAYVMAHVSARLRALGDPEHRLMLISAPDGPVGDERRYDTPSIRADATLLHGHLDEVVPLDQALRFAERSGCLLTAFPGTDHMFTSTRDRLGAYVRDWLDRS